VVFDKTTTVNAYCNHRVEEVKYISQWYLIKLPPSISGANFNKNNYEVMNCEEHVAGWLEQWLSGVRLLEEVCGCLVPAAHLAASH
jgi:hypothetical protein